MTPRPCLQALVVVALVGPGCALHSPDADEPLVALDDPDVGYRPGQAPPDEPAEPAEPAPEAPRHREGHITRAEVDRVLADGPGPMLAQVPVEAVVKDGAFAGWRLQSAPFTGVDLQPGDVVLGVNRRTLQHPLELKLLWDELKSAEAISVDVARGSEKFTLDFQIVAEAQAGAANAAGAADDQLAP